MGHGTRECPKQEDATAYRCVPCGKASANHTSWDRECPIRRRQTERARHAYNVRPTRFQVRGLQAHTVQQQASPAATTPRVVQKKAAAAVPQNESVRGKKKDTSPPSEVNSPNLSQQTSPGGVRVGEGEEGERRNEHEDLEESRKRRTPDEPGMDTDNPRGENLPPLPRKRKGRPPMVSLPGASAGTQDIRMALRLTVPTPDKEL